VPKFLFFLFFLTLSTALWPQAQSSDTLTADTLNLKSAKKVRIKAEKEIKIEAINPLAPSKAAFYSAVLPGLGQAYNKRYWKIPIVLGAIGTGTYAYLYNDDLYDRFRDAFKRRLAGFSDDEFWDLNTSDGIRPESPNLSNEALQDAQERYQRDRDLALLITIGLYALNIIDANVDAHLKQYNVNEELSLQMQPYLELNPISQNPHYGLAFHINF
jgi:hypothetical protein